MGGGAEGQLAGKGEGVGTSLSPEGVGNWRRLGFSEWSSLSAGGQSSIQPPNHGQGTQGAGQQGEQITAFEYATRDEKNKVLSLASGLNALGGINAISNTLTVSHNDQRQPQAQIQVRTDRVKSLREESEDTDDTCDLLIKK